MSIIIDTHTHLLDERFDKDRDEVITRAANEGIILIESALNENEWLSADGLSKKYANFYYTAGFHPHEADKRTAEQLERLEKFCECNRVVGIGETGLDYHYLNSSKKEQQSVFRKQIEIAFKLSKPLVVHCRDAYDDCISILESFSNKYRGVIHCFSGELKDAIKFIELGFFIGVDGPITYPNAALLRDVVSKIKADNILFETDSPYLSPQSSRGKRNEPVNIKEIVEMVSIIKSISVKELSELSSNNAKRLFGI